MFGQLYSLVKENLNDEVLDKADISKSSHEAIANETSGVIIDVLKSQIDKGRYKDLLTVFRVNHVESHSLVKAMSSKLAIRLNKYYQIEMAAAKKFSNAVIPEILRKFAAANTPNSEESENILLSFFNKLSGNTINFETLFGKMPQLTIV